MCRHCFCCGGEHEQPSVVECDVHGPMEMDWRADGFRCAAGSCGAFLSLDAWMARLGSGVAIGSAAPVRLMVTPPQDCTGSVP